MKSVIPNSALWWGGLRFQLPSCFVPQHEGMASSRKALARAGRVPTRSLRELKSRPQVGRGLRRLGGARGSRRFGRCGPGTTKLLRSRARRPSTGDAKAELVAAPLSSFRLQRARLVRVVNASSMTEPCDGGPPAAALFPFRIPDSAFLPRNQRWQWYSAL